MMATIKHVGIDIEGCLTPRKGESILLGGFQIFQEQATTLSVPIGLSTGRPQPYVEFALQALGLIKSMAPSIVECGCFLYIPGQDILVPHPDLDTSIFGEIRRTLEEKLPKGLRIEPGKEVCLSINPSAGVTTRELCEKVMGILGDQSRAVVSYSNSAVDVTPKGIDKAAGLRFLCERQGITLEEVLMIGDAGNDQTVMASAGFAGCPGNATDEIKQLVREKGDRGYIAEANYIDGVVEILRHFHVFQ